MVVFEIDVLNLFGEKLIFVKIEELFREVGYIFLRKIFY